MFKLGLEKAEEPEIKLPTSVGSYKKQGNSRKTSTSASLTMIKPLCGSQQTGKFLEMGIPDHLNCVLRNLYAGQEATVRTGNGTTDWSNRAPYSHHTCVQTGKGTLTPGLQDGLLAMIMKVSQNTDYVTRYLTAIPPSPRVFLWASRIFKV